MRLSDASDTGMRDLFTRSVETYDVDCYFVEDLSSYEEWMEEITKQVQLDLCN